MQIAAWHPLPSAQLVRQAVHSLQECQKVARQLVFPCLTVSCLRARQTQVRAVHRLHDLPNPQMLHPIKILTSFLLHCSAPVVWRTNLRQSEQYWTGWYSGLSDMYLSVTAPKILILAGTDRLDKPLTIGQMQGKFQMSLLPQVHACLERCSRGL